MSRSARGSSGGGRSSSSGGSRGFSGGMSSSGRSSRGSSSSSRSSSSSSRSRGYSSPTRHYHRHYGGYSYGGYRRRSSMTCGNLLAFAIIILFIFMMIGFMVSDGGSVSTSTIQREPLPMSMSKETSYYTDNLGWIRKPAKLESGMKEFYKATGVQPHLYIAGDVEGDDYPDNIKVEAWMDKTYDELFTDEAHLMFLFLDNGYDYGSWILVGKEANSVIDMEAQGIIHDYLDRYVTSDMDDEEMFSTVFSKSAQRIMTVHESPWAKVLTYAIVIAGGVIIVRIVLAGRRKKREQQLIKNQQDIDILNTPLEKIKDYSHLEEKYKD